MGFLEKAKEMLGKHDDKVDQAMDKAGEFAKGKFQGHDEHIDKATQMGKDYDFSGGTATPREAAPPAEGTEERPPAP
jgi:antitoxin protein of toxin-antitoxin system